MFSVTRKSVLSVSLLAAMTVGCTTYYKVTDPTTGKVYYTTELEERNSGATTLKDARTGGEVTVQNSEVVKINKEEFETGKVAPAPATAPAAPAKDPKNPFN